MREQLKKALASKNAKLAVVAGSLSAAGSAFAETGTFDMTPINDAVATMTSIGTAVFAVVVTIKVFKWAKSAL